MTQFIYEQIAEIESRQQIAIGGGGGVGEFTCEDQVVWLGLLHMV